MMLKDLNLAQEAARMSGANTPLGAEAAQLYGLLASHGSGGLDFSAIINLIRGSHQ
jgi:3-hydroxyisobutyrate dehydrogenase